MLTALQSYLNVLSFVSTLWMSFSKESKQAKKKLKHTSRTFMLVKLMVSLDGFSLICVWIWIFGLSQNIMHECLKVNWYIHVSQVFGGSWISIMRWSFSVMWPSWWTLSLGLSAKFLSVSVWKSWDLLNQSNVIDVTVTWLIHVPHFLNILLLFCE